LLRTWVVGDLTSEGNAGSRELGLRREAADKVYLRVPPRDANIASSSLQFNFPSGLRAQSNRSFGVAGT